MIFSTTETTAGSDSGIGQATATLLASEGFDVGLTFHTDEEGIRRTAEEVARRGQRSFVEPFDASSPDAGAVVDRLADLIALQGSLAGYGCTVQDDDALLEAYFDEHADEFIRRCVVIAQFVDPQAAEDFRAQVEAGG